MNRCHRGPPRRASQRRIMQGFTLIELMIVVAIISILAAIAIPNFRVFQCRSRANEAKIVLRTIYQAEAVYRAEHGEYFSAVDSSLEQFGVDFTAAGIEIDGKRRYRYSVATPNSDAFSALANGEGSMAPYKWSISQDNVLENVDPACD